MSFGRAIPIGNTEEASKGDSDPKYTICIAGDIVTASTPEPSGPFIYQSRKYTELIESLFGIRNCKPVYDKASVASHEVLVTVRVGWSPSRPAEINYFKCAR